MALAMGAPERLSGQGCDELVAYTVFDANYTLNAQHELHLSGTASWNAAFNGMQVHGQIIIESGGLLTIDNATIHFADSRQMTYRTAIIVRPGGKLIVQNHAVLTSLNECPDSMWDGVVVEGVPSAPESSGLQGQLTMRSFAKIENAIVGVITGSCADPVQWGTEFISNTGGIVDCENAWFMDNFWGVVLRPYDHPGNGGETATHFFGCTFAADGPLNVCDDPDDIPPPPEEPCDDVIGILLYAREVGHLRIGGCTFYNNYGPLNWTDVSMWGSAIVAYNTSISVLPLCDGVYTGLVPCVEPAIRTINDFRGFFRGIAVSNWSPDKYAEVVRSEFDQTIRSIHLQGVSHSVLVHNKVSVPLDPLNVVAPRGIGLSNCSAFEVQENELRGPLDNSMTQSNTGLWLSGTGNGPNTFYKNQFLGKLTTANIIQGLNDGPEPDDGLEFKCNNYGYNDLGNRYDVAFTGPNVTVGEQQGMMGDAGDAAGNTFSPGTCETPGTHMWVTGAINNFTYWHHDPNSTSEVVLPVCRTNPPLVNNWFINTFSVYGDGVEACQSQTDLFGGGGGEPVVVVDAEENYALIREAYNEARDGGDTRGLSDFIADPAHSSYDIRNQLMLVAPDVSREVWEQVFALDPPMNPWHLAQALLANVPLQTAVIDLMNASGINNYYKDLVTGAQGDGISNLTIQESELSHWKHRRERALNAHALGALRSGDPLSMRNALQFQQEHPQPGLPLNELGLLMALGEYTEAKDVVDGLPLAEVPDESMEVLGMYLGLRIAGLTINDVSTSDRARLHDIADRSPTGQGQAQAWLECIGDGPFEDGMIEPGELHAMQLDAYAEDDGANELLSAFPNPSVGKQPVYVVVRLPEGMELVTLRVSDATGRLIKEETVARKVSIIEVDAVVLVPGLYACGLYMEELQVASTKFEVIR